MATEYAGESLQTQTNGMTQELVESAKAALASVHRCGVLHGNIHLANFVVDVHGVVRLLGFTHSVLKEEIADEEEWIRRVKEEQDELRNLLAS